MNLYSPLGIVCIVASGTIVAGGICAVIRYIERKKKAYRR